MAVGSILGVTKEVDMKFTRNHDISRLQVMMLYPNLIPQYVDVVIGDYLYELQFRVEEKMDDNNPEPMDMDNDANNGDNSEQGKKEGDNQMDSDKTKPNVDNSGSKALKGSGTPNEGAKSGGKQAKQWCT